MKYLVTAIGSISAEAVIQALSQQSGAVAVGCSIYPREWTAASRLVDCFHQVPPACDTTAYLSRLIEICKSEQISHVIPLTDPEVDVLSADRPRFDEIGVKLCISPQPAIRLARDKLAIHQCFANHPRIRPIQTADLQEEGSPDFGYPLLAKPRHGRSSERQVDIPDPTALRFWRGRLSEEDYVVQPRCNGEVFVVDMVRQPDGRRSAAMTRRELLRTPNGAGLTVHMQPGHACDMLALEAAGILGLSGCVNMEFLVGNGVPLLMDVNPRLSAGIAFSMMSGYDMVSNHLRCFDGRQIEDCMPPPDRVYARGLVEYSPQD
ncbi:ATP-grasp domain-containing protein [Luteimonas changyuni]|uniref:ATP-grasp domain-containing protein n=1 Tax=Luteimonas sp. MJ145 TaxID=3129234 RepID=UPI0031BA4935